MTKDPLRRSRRLKRNQLLKRTLVLAVMLAIIILPGIAFFYIPYFSIDSVSFDGIKTVSAENVQDITRGFLHQKKWGIFPQNNFFIFLFAANGLGKTLTARIPKIERITFKKRLPRTVIASVEERKTWGTLCSYASCFYMDKNGFLFGKSSRISGSLFFAIEDTRDTALDTGTFPIAEDQLSGIQKLLGKIESTTGDPFEALTLSGSADLISKYEARAKTGWKIIFDSKTNNDVATANFVSAYEGILKKDMTTLDYIDLRLENKIFYKYKPR